MGFLAAHGAIALALGVTIFWPHVAAATFVLLVGLWSIFGGIVMMNLSLFMSGTIRSWPLYLAGTAGFFFGIFLVLEPLSGRLLLTWGIGACAIFGGVALVVSAVTLGRSGRRRGRQAQRSPGTVPLGTAAQSGGTAGISTRNPDRL